MKNKKFKIRNSYISPAVWAITLGVLLLLGGAHTGLIVLLMHLNANPTLHIFAIISYWLIVALGFTILTHHQMKRSYEAPIREIAEFAGKVAAGDFSVYLPTRHSADRYDFLDTLILDLNKMVEDLGSIETLKTEFFSNVSHEIKTPLSVIQNTAELLLNGNLSPDEQQRHVQTIILSSKRLSALISNILKLNKLEKQAILPQPGNYDLCLQLSECALQFEHIWEEKEIEFECELDDRIPICADESLMEIVWTNLLSNAFKFTGRGGRVSLTQASEEGAVAVTISDTGCGMPEDTLKHIFDKFYQGDTSHSAEGNGLGLALVRRILQLMNASISVESRVGEGTSFTVRIPAQMNSEGETAR
ncbi:MAG: HAMP domain-containing histidine kinase [Clostridia bacterium]|nr:HAMP domain-containing histidine kinase [Clostridia bacterium]